MQFTSRLSGWGRVSKCHLLQGTPSGTYVDRFCWGERKNSVNYHFCHHFISKYCVIVVPCKFLTISHAGLPYICNDYMYLYNYTYKCYTYTGKLITTTAKVTLKGGEEKDLVLNLKSTRRSYGFVAACFFIVGTVDGWNPAPVDR